MVSSILYKHIFYHDLSKIAKKKEEYLYSVTVKTIQGSTLFVDANILINIRGSAEFLTFCMS